MRSEFDTIRREQLIEILKSFLDEDEVRIIRLLLNHTTLYIRLNNVETEPFTSKEDVIREMEYVVFYFIYNFKHL